MTALAAQTRTVTDLGAERIERETPAGLLVFEKEDR